MYNIDLFKSAVNQYKREFDEKIWPNEKFKWEAIQNFQDNWDIDAENFSEMLFSSLSGAEKLLNSNNNYSLAMIKYYAEVEKEEVRLMFRELYNEKEDIFRRINNFKIKANSLLERYSKKEDKHYQNENAISIYLWLRYPDNYYIYKFSEVKKAVNKLEANYKFKKGNYEFNIDNFLNFYNEINSEIKKDIELRSMLQTKIKEGQYPDYELKTLTIDIVYFISRDFNEIYSGNQEKIWWPNDYSPKITVEKWIELLQDKDVFNKFNLQIMRRMLDYGGEATCKQLAIKYGENVNFYNAGSSSLAKRIAKKTNCPILPREDNENSRFWPILYVGRTATKGEEGAYVWKLRDELLEALQKIDLSNVDLYVTDKENDKKFWFLNANPKIWRMSSMCVGEEQSYTLYNGNGNKRRIFQNFLDAKIGDLVIGYESTPVKKIVAILRVSREHAEERIYFEKVEGLSSPIDFSLLKEYSELERMEYFRNSQGSLFKLTKGEYDFILDIIREENPQFLNENKDKYTKKEFLRDVYLSDSKYDRLVSVLKKKKNIILQGAPGVGKTFVATRLAYSIMGEKDDNRLEFVQFHQNYSYEDFVMGYKPVDNGFELKNGIFYKFCQKAINNPDESYFFIIDEINRGNMSKIFGELLLLIEAEYRNKSITLAYNGLNFSVPKNVFIIGMMNTADRSLSLIDYALRRRFSFVDMEPGFDTEGFINYQKHLSNNYLNNLVELIKELNKDILEDKTLGKGFCLGHSYFCNIDECTIDLLKDIVDFDILPMINEYWFDENEKLLYWGKKLRGIFDEL